MHYNQASMAFRFWLISFVEHGQMCRHIKLFCYVGISIVLILNGHSNMKYLSKTKGIFYT